MKRLEAAVLFLIIGLAAMVQVRPWLPGDHDPVAVGLSWAIQALALAAFLLVPLGVARFFLPEGRIVAAALMGALCLVGILVVGVALLQGGGTLGALVLIVLLAGAGGLRRLPPRPQGAILILLPTALALIQIAALPSLEVAARRGAMDAAQALITDVEAYARTHGEPPESLLAVWPDYATGVVGVAPFRYERRGASWQVTFETPRPIGPTRTIAVYAPDGRWAAHSHDSHRMSLPDVDQSGGRGWFEDTPGDRPGWRLFHFD